MSLSAAIAIIVVLDMALLGFIAWMMSHPRRLTPHVSMHDLVEAVEDRFFIKDPAEQREPEPVYRNAA